MRDFEVPGVDDCTGVVSSVEVLIVVVGVTSLVALDVRNDCSVWTELVLFEA